VADCLDVVAVGIQDEGPVVLRVVDLAHAGTAVVPRPGPQAASWKASTVSRSGLVKATWTGSRTSPWRIQNQGLPSRPKPTVPGKL